MKIPRPENRKVKRKQAQVETNLPGITLPTEMARGFISLSLITILGVLCLKKAQNIDSGPSDQVGATSSNFLSIATETPSTDHSIFINTPFLPAQFSFHFRQFFRQFSMGLM